MDRESVFVPFSLLLEKNWVKEKSSPLLNEHNTIYDIWIHLFHTKNRQCFDRNFLNGKHNTPMKKTMNWLSLKLWWIDAHFVEYKSETNEIRNNSNDLTESNKFKAKKQQYKKTERTRLQHVIGSL